MKKSLIPPLPSDLSLDKKNIIGLSLLLVLSIHFSLGYIVFSFYPEDLLNIESPGFWLMLLNYSLICLLALFNKYFFRWKWSQLGLKKPANIWRFLMVSLGTFGAILLFAIYIQPTILEAFGPHQNLSFLNVIKGNLNNLILGLLYVWITAAFIEELVFRAFLINSLNLLLGSGGVSLVASVLISALVFGAIHSYQGVTGILVTTGVGLIFGVAFIINGRRIWPLILIHGLLDTLTLLSVYHSA